MNPPNSDAGEMEAMSPAFLRGLAALLQNATRYERAMNQLQDTLRSAAHRTTNMPITPGLDDQANAEEMLP